MFTRIGRAVCAHPVIVVVAWVSLALVAAALVVQGLGHGGLFARLADAEVSTPGTESSYVTSVTADEGAEVRISVVVTGVDVAGDYASAAAAANSARAELLEVAGVSSASDAFTAADPRSQQAKASLSSDGDGYVVIVTLDEALSDKEVQAASERVDEVAQGAYLDTVRKHAPRAEAYAVSSELVSDSIGGLVQQDLAQGESVSLPVALALLVIVFGGLLAAGLPLMGAVFSILIGMGTLWCLTFVFDVHSLILNVISLIGVALSIDYGLLLVSRYREEVQVLLQRQDADLPRELAMEELVRQGVVRTVATAGRTVSFSALTIACSIAGLLVMSSPMLKTIAAGSICVALVSVCCTVTLVPAVIVLLGERLVRPSVLQRAPGLSRVLRAVGDSSSDHGVFSRLSHRVVAHPWLVMLLVLVVLGLMASPIGSLSMRTNVIEYMPADSSVRHGYDVLQEEYPALATPAVTIVAQADAAEVTELAEDIGALEDVTHVEVSSLDGHEGMTRISVLMDVDDPVGEQVSAAVDRIRGADAEYDFWVGGAAAQQADFIDSLLDRAPWAALIVIVAVFVLLFGMTGSLIVPLKALIINIFSLIASLGATAWLFAGGHLGLPLTPGLQTFIVACLVAFGFGLAMDYEVFLLARITEYWESGYSNDEAVARGLQRSGRIITSAAAIIIAVFLGFVTGEMISIKEIGVGLAIMVAADATLVRLLLVPATMTVLGRWNWWAPTPLKRLYGHLRQRGGAVGRQRPM